MSTLTDTNPEQEGTPDHSAYAADLFAAAREELARRRAVPELTYRLQFHAGFTFRDATAIVPYLADLGISDCYASPYLKAAPGSTHGYDITDHQLLNPEIGTPEDHAALLEALRDHGLGLVLDVVPNHMGILGNENPWWNDVLENGQASPYAGYFDIDWWAPTRPENRGRVLLPLLGDLYGEVLERGELRVAWEGEAFHVQYYDHRFPLDPKGYQAILEPALGPISAALGAEHDAVLEFQSILTAIRNLPEHSESAAERVTERHREKEIIKRRIATLLARQPLIGEAIATSLADLNGTPGDPRSFDAPGPDARLAALPAGLLAGGLGRDQLPPLLRHQRAGRPAYRSGGGLARHSRPDPRDRRARGRYRPADRPPRWPARPEDLSRATPGGVCPRHCAASARGQFQRRVRPLAGNRAAPPQADCSPSCRSEGSPRALCRRGEVLGFDETFPADWPTHGTSGYEALNRINGLFVDPGSAAEFTRRYHEWIGDYTAYREIVRDKKLLILDVSLASELHVLAHQLERIALRDRRSRDFTQNSLRHALREVIASFPVYRSYITANHVSEQDRMLVDRAVLAAMRRNPVMGRQIFRFLRNVLLDRVPTPDDLPEHEPAPADFAGKFQQVTAPAMAKGLEDTTFYVYNRLVSLNEVGGEPSRFGLSPDSLHRWSADRAARIPFALTALSTHDTKRSEDVRARIDVLSEVPDLWFQAVERWSALNARHRARIEDQDVPDRNEEYFFYQNLLGAWPLEEMDDEAFSAFRDRVRAFMAKAIHEAKVNSSWQNPDPEYDEGIDRFVQAVLDRTGNSAFLDDFLPFERFVTHHGMINSLAQTLLKIALPGVPDTYQGTELWNFSLVDPDNRRPVDYAQRAALLGELITRHGGQVEEPARLARDLAARPGDGRIKLYTIWRGLACRRLSGAVLVRRISALDRSRPARGVPLRIHSSVRSSDRDCRRPAPDDTARLTRPASPRS